jgi:hypothetical protein
VTFSVQCKALKLPEPVAEYRFAPPRRWRFDWAFLEQKLALEVQGGLFSNGRHVRGAALLREYEKLNAAAARGWRVMFTTPQDMANGNAVLLVEQGLK